MNRDKQLIGIVQEGRFQILSPEPRTGDAVRLTHIQMQESIPPESRELDLSEYEGEAIMVSGHDGGDWVYAASIVDHAGPLLTAVVRQVFAPSEPDAAA